MLCFLSDEKKLAVSNEQLAVQVSLCGDDFLYCAFGVSKGKIEI